MSIRCNSRGVSQKTASVIQGILVKGETPAIPEEVKGNGIQGDFFGSRHCQTAVCKGAGKKTSKMAVGFYLRTLDACY